MPAFRAKTIAEILPVAANFSVVAIDEGHFVRNAFLKHFILVV